MKVTITHMKAPWPDGARPGHVVDLQGSDTIPGWALGKCRPAGDAAADFTFGEISGDGSGEPLAPIDEGELAALREFKAQGEAAFTRLREQHAAEVQRLQADIDAGGKTLQGALDDAEEQRRLATDLKAKLGDAEAALATAKAAAPAPGPTEAKGKAAK